MAATIIRLLSGVSLDNSYKDTFDFASASNQASFFATKTVRTMTNATFQRYSGNMAQIRYNGNVEEIRSCNYLMYQNSNNTSKWFYAFITNMEFQSQNVAIIDFEIDVIQTYYFEMNIEHCYIERETVADDTIGLHTQDENLNTEELILSSGTTGINLTALQDLTVIVGTNYDANSQTDLVGGTVYDNVYSGLVYFAFDNDAAGLSDLYTFLDTTNADAKLDSVVTIFMMPTEFVPSYSNGDIVDSTTLSLEYSFTATATFANIDGYTPRNNKLYCYPYFYLEITDNNGNVNQYRWEYADTVGEIDFDVRCPIEPNPKMRLYPLNYKNDTFNFQESIYLTGLPLCSWSGDAYTSWLAQNTLSGALSTVSSAVGVGVGVASGNPIAVAGGLVGVGQSIGSFYQASLLPNTSKGSYSGKGNVGINKGTYTIYPRSIRAEQARIIDEYFSRYGYKVNRLQVPNITSRPFWNYVKCHEATITGNMPTVAVTRIKQAFVDGITFWHGDYVGEYNRDNSI